MDKHSPLWNSRWFESFIHSQRKRKLKRPWRIFNLSNQSGGSQRIDLPDFPLFLIPHLLNHFYSENNQAELDSFKTWWSIIFLKAKNLFFKVILNLNSQFNSIFQGMIQPTILKIQRKAMIPKNKTLQLKNPFRIS